MDACIYQDARSKDLCIPEGKFFLADSGFPHCWELLIPYRNVRYHLAEWRRAQLRCIYLLLHELGCTDLCRPVNREELFNLRHASARNVVEWIFGVLKRRFHILLLSPEYKMQIQVCFHLHGAVCYNIYTQPRIPVALCAIHNFIRIHDGNEDPVLGQDNGEAYNEDRFEGVAGEAQKEDA